MSRTLTVVEKALQEKGYTELFGLGLWAPAEEKPVVDTNSGTAKMVPYIDASFDNFLGFADTIEELDALFVKWDEYVAREANAIPDYMLLPYIQGHNSEKFEAYAGPSGPTAGQADRNTIALFCKAKREHDCDNLTLKRMTIPMTDEEAVMIVDTNSELVMSYDRWGFCAENTDEVIDQLGFDDALHFLLMNS